MAIAATSPGYVTTSGANGLLPLDRIEQRLEVALAEALRALELIAL